MTTPYTILGVDPAASQDEIKAAWRRLVKLHHPDTGVEPDPERFADISNAWTTLSSDERRSRFDSTGDDGTEEQRMEDREVRDSIRQMIDVITTGNLAGGVKIELLPTDSHDQIKGLMQGVNGVHVKLQREAGATRQAITRCEDILKRTRMVDDGEDIVRDALGAQLRQLKEQLAVQARHIRVNRRCAEILRRYRYRTVERLTGSAFPTFSGAAGGPLPRFFSPEGGAATLNRSEGEEPIG